MLRMCGMGSQAAAITLASDFTDSLDIGLDPQKLLELFKSDVCLTARLASLMLADFDSPMTCVGWWCLLGHSAMKG
jgi:hypothetical protein